MYGAILGDIIGSPYEFDRGSKTKDFPLFCKYSTFTDDTVMTLAVAMAFLSIPADTETAAVHWEVTRTMQHFGRRYPHAGYGARSAIGSGTGTRSPTTAGATAPPCVSLLLDGCTMI